MDEPVASPTPTPPAEHPRMWRHHEATAAAERRRAFAVGLVLALIVAGGLVALVGWLRPVARPTLIVVGEATGGAFRVPQWEGDRRALSGLAAFEAGAVEAASVAGGIAAIRADLHPGPLVVYLCARAWIGDGDDPGGLPSLRFSAPEGPSLAELLRAIRDRPGVAKLLILDVHPPPDDPRAGAILGDVAAVIADASRGAVAPGMGLSILASCEPGQRPLASDALGRSAFGYYIEQGLKGAADASGDGRVTVRELAAFARDRVGRWSRHVRDAAQSPTLYDDPASDDLPLALVPRRMPEQAELPKDAPAYPDWLAGAWRGRDADRASGADREAPRLMGQVESAILGAERAWRGGLDQGRIQADLAEGLGRLRERIGPTRAIDRPTPRSLALEEALGRSPDPEILKATREAVAGRPRPAPDAKPGEFEAAEARAIAAFHDPTKLKLRSEFDLAHAVFRVAVEDAAPTRDSIDFLHRIQAIVEEKPRYVETDALRRIAGGRPGAWKPGTIRRALALIQRGERAQARPSSLLGPSQPLDDADRLRHEAEVLFDSPGYVTAGELDRRLEGALAATDLVLSRSAAVEEARWLADRASAVLPVAATLLDVAPDLEDAWLSAADEARAVLDRLDPAPGVEASESPDDLPERAEALRAALAPFEPPALARRVTRLTRPGPGPTEAREIDALLATPLPTADQRLALWKAGIDADRRLVSDCLRLDAIDGRAIQAPGGAPIRPGGDLLERLASGPTPRRIRVSQRLLTLGGLPPEPSAGPSMMARSLAARWAGLLDSVRGATGRSAASRDRLARLVPSWLDDPSLDDPASDPTRARRVEEFAGLRRRLAARYAFEARDAEGSGFHAEAARDFEGPGDRPGESLRIDPDPVDLRLAPDHPDATVRLGLRIVDPAGPARARVEIASAGGEWLDLGPGGTWPGDRGAAPSAATDLLRFNLLVNADPVVVPIRLTLRPESGPREAPIPAGLLVRARVGERTFHRRIPLRVEPESRQLRAELTLDPAGKGPAVSEVRLRAVRGKTPFALHVRNPGDRDRRVVVDLLDHREPIAGASTDLLVRAGGSTRVAFGPPASKPDEGFVELRGPLSIRLTDPDGPGGPIVRPISVGLASPSEIARVVSARFEPADPARAGMSKLEFQVRAVASIDGPACPVELSLPIDRIPGLVAPGEGSYFGKLANFGDVVTLTAEGIKVDDRKERPGYVHLSVDGVERAFVFRTRFARQRGATIPIQEVRPAIRLRVGASGHSSAPLPVGVDLDLPPEGGKVEVELGQYVADGPRADFRADSAATSESSRGRVRLNPRGPDGALVFEAGVRDPSVTLDVGKVRGRRLVRARLKDERGEVVARAEEPVVLDDRPPADVRLVDVPKYGLKGGTVTLLASGSVPDSGLKEVVFFAGRPADGKRPAGVATVPGRPVDPGRTTWTAALPLADAKVGPVEVSVEFVAGVGLGRFDTATLAVVEAIPAEPGTIRGSVREGSRPQPGFEVRVLDEKGAEKGKVRTDEAGRFEVAGIAPGNYEVVSIKETPPTRGSARVAVKSGETVRADVAMFRVR